MIDQPDQPRPCPNCGFNLPPNARYCPECGTRVSPAPYDPDAFRAAIDDAVGGEQEDARPAPEFKPIAPSPVAPPAVQESVPTPPASEPTWTASPSGWSGQPVTPVREPRGWRNNRTLWIIFAIFGFIIFCCCGLGFLLFILASFDSSFQSQVSAASILI